MLIILKYTGTPNPNNEYMPSTFPYFLILLLFPYFLSMSFVGVRPYFNNGEISNF